MTDRSSLLRHEFRCRGDDQEDESSQDAPAVTIAEDYVLPQGIEIDIYPASGRPSDVRQSFTKYGRSVHFVDGTPYHIGIRNSRKDLETCRNKGKVSVCISVDGRKVHMTPILVRSERRPRVIKGFTVGRRTVEGVDKYEIHSDIENFVASRPETTSAAVDSRVGTIRFEFFEVMYRTRSDAGQAPRDRRQYRPKKCPNRGAARPGVLQSQTGGTTTTTTGMHSFDRSVNRRMPVADTDHPPEVCEITICEQRSNTLSIDMPVTVRPVEEPSVI